MKEHTCSDCKHEADQLLTITYSNVRIGVGLKYSRYVDGIIRDKLNELYKYVTTHGYP